MDNPPKIRRLFNALILTFLFALALSISAEQPAQSARAQQAGTNRIKSIEEWAPIAAPDNANRFPPCYSSAVWTGSEMILWGGWDSSGIDLRIGQKYLPAKDTWKPISNQNAPTIENCTQSVWTGTEMIVWGYVKEPYTNASTFHAGRYDPKVDTWSAVSADLAPHARVYAGVWTGAELILWRGPGKLYSGRYNPATNTWSPVSSMNSPVEIRQGHTVVWTGTDMIVWGGASGSIYLNTGARYNPAADTWTLISIINAPQARTLHRAVWTGTEMIVWGGWNCPDCSGGRYNPVTDTWAPLSAVNAPTVRDNNSLVWTGTEMIVWGGIGSFPSTAIFNTGARYNPLTDTWTNITADHAPSARHSHIGVWTGTEMLIWGGQGSTGEVLGDGARYKFLDVNLMNKVYFPIISIRESSSLDPIEN